MSTKPLVTCIFLSLLFVQSVGLGTCVSPTNTQINNLGSNSDYLCLRPDFTITQYASSSDGLVKPRIMDHIIYQNNLIVYVGSVKGKAPDYSLVPGTHVRAMVDSNMDGIVDNTVDVFDMGNEEFNVVTIDPITNYVYIVSQENMYRCDNLHAYTLDLVATNATNIVNGGCQLFIAFPVNKVELTHARHYAEFSLPNYKDLCIAFGADCDICINQTVPRTTMHCYDMSIIRTKYNSSDFPIDWDGPEGRIVATGVRNSVGFDWHPITYDLWFTDNGANHIWDPSTNNGVDWKSDSPDDELNVITVGNEGGHYGYPFVHTEGIGNLFIRDINDVSLSFQDPQLWQYRPSGMEYNNFILAKQAMSPHSACLGIKFYNRDQLILDNCANGEKPKLFPSEYNNRGIIAEHGSHAADTSGYRAITGYRVVTVDIDVNTNTITNLSNFIYGFREESEDCQISGGSCALQAWSRPSFIEILYDGSILISDDTGHYIWRVQYNGADATTYDCPTTQTGIPSKSPSVSPIMSNTQSKSPGINPTMKNTQNDEQETFGVNFSEFNEWNMGQWIIVSVVIVLFLVYLIVLICLCCSKCTNRHTSLKKGTTQFSIYEMNDQIEMTGQQKHIQRSVDV